MGRIYDNTISVDADGNATISGDLTVNGDTATISTTNSVISDKLIELANGTSGTPAGDAGIVVERGSSTNAGLVWDESADTWVVCTTSATGASTGNLTLTDAALKTAAITASGNITTSGDIIIDDGGSLKEAGGTAAITFDGSGHVTKIGQDSPSSGQFLKWDGSKAVWDAASGEVAGSVAADDISAGDAAINLTTTAGNITIDAQGNDTDIIFKGTDGSADTTFLTIDGSAAGAATFNDKIIATELDISGDADIDGTLEADAYTVDGVALATYIRDTVGTNMLSSNTESGITVTYDTSNDNIDFAIDAAQTGITSILATDVKIGEDDQTKIDFETANQINFYADNAKRVTIDSTGLTVNSGSIETATIDYTDGDLAITIADGGGITAAAGITSTAAANTLGATSFNDADITNVGDIALDSISADGTDINVAVSDNSATALTIKEGSNAYLIVDTANSSESVSIGTGVSGTAITLGHATSETTVADNLTITGDLAANGDTATFASANSQDPLLIIKNTTNDANGARLRFVKDKGAAGADNDVAGLIEFYADDDNQDQVLFGKIEGIVADASNGAEGGAISLSVATHDGEIQPGFTIQDGSAEDEIDVFIANGTSSVTTIAGDVKLDGAGLKIKEAPNAPADTAAYGQLWVKNETPCELYFTTDAGDDIQLTDGTSAAGGGGGSVSNDDANLILAIQSFS